jgi:exodeoxyribonuclease VII large subunit
MTKITETEPLTVTAYAMLIQRAAKTVGAAVLEGEVQRPRKTGGGALMFDLTDGQGRLNCKVLPWTLRAGIAHEPAEGDLVRLEVAYPDFWPVAGSLAVVVEEIELAGDGELLKRRRALLKKLEAEGLTDPARFTALPRFPRAVGVIAGVGSDALRDVVQCLGERFPVAKVITACCQVQGAAAPRAVIDALAALALHRQVDVIIVARGGGSVRDLAAFDDEALCRAITAIETPIVTAIGHTDNDPVCNHVTHAAYLPRHAAEIVVPDRAALIAELGESQAAVARSVARFRRQSEEFDARCLGLRGRARIQARQGEVAEVGRIVDAATATFITEASGVLTTARERLAAAPGRIRGDLSARERDLDHAALAAADAAARPRRQAEELDQLSQRFARAVRRVLGERKTNWIRALERHGESVSQAARRALRHTGQDLDQDGAELARAGQRRMRRLNDEITSLIALANANDHRGRGWILAVGVDGRAITSIGDVSPRDRLRLHVRDGGIDTVVEELYPEPQSKEKR